MNALERAPRLLEARLAFLEKRVRPDDERGWAEYLQTILVLNAVLQHTAPGAGGKLITTKALADLMGCAPKTILRRRKAGAIGGAVQLGRRGRGALRWDVGAAVSGVGR